MNETQRKNPDLRLQIGIFCLDIPLLNEIYDGSGIVKSVGMVSAAFLSVDGKRNTRFLISLFEDVAVFGIGNDVVAVAVDHDDGNPFTDERRDLVDGVAAEADQFAFRHAERVEDLFIESGTSVDEAIAHAERPAEEIHDGGIEIQDTDKGRIFCREIDCLQAAAAHADGDAFFGKSVRFVQIFRKSCLGVGVNVRAYAVDVFQICEVVSSAEQSDLDRGERAEIFGLQHPARMFRALGRENEGCVSALEFKFNLAKFISPYGFCHGERSFPIKFFRYLHYIGYR